MFQMFAHGIMTALLFSSVGYIYDRTHTKLIPELGGLSRIMPVASAFFIVAALAGMGVPGLANFWGELVVFVSAFKSLSRSGVVAVLALVVTALFMLRVVQKTFYGPENERFAKLPDVLSGIAQLESFEQSLVRLGSELVYSKRFADHHRFTQQEVLNAINRSKKRQAETIITTQKDAVRFPKIDRRDLPVYFMRVEMKILRGADDFQDCVRKYFFCFR